MLRSARVAVSAMSLVCAALALSNPPSTFGGEAPDAAALKSLVALRDDFIGRIRATGASPSLRAPEIVQDNPPSLGNYDVATNQLHTGNWRTLPPEMQEVFERQAKAAGNGKTAEWMFEQAALRWIFVHELGHWWRACQHQKTSFYDEEMGANRIAAAYWRERDPELMEFTLKKFQRYIDNIPNPVPAGESKEVYLNEHYESLGDQRAYIWFQATMVLDVAAEKPVLTFKQAIAQSGNKQ